MALPLPIPPVKFLPYLLFDLFDWHTHHSKEKTASETIYRKQDLVGLKMPPSIFFSSTLIILLENYSHYSQNYSSFVLSFVSAATGSFLLCSYTFPARKQVRSYIHLHITLATYYTISLPPFCIWKQNGSSDEERFSITVGVQFYSKSFHSHFPLYAVCLLLPRNGCRDK